MINGINGEGNRPKGGKMKIKISHFIATGTRVKPIFWANKQMKSFTRMHI